MYNKQQHCYQTINNPMKNIIITTAFLLISILSSSQNIIDEDKFEKSVFIEINGGLKYSLFYDTGYKNERLKSNTPFNTDIFLGLDVETQKGYLIGKAGFGINPFNYTHYYQSSINGEWFDYSNCFKYISCNYTLNVGYLHKLKQHISCGFSTGIVFITSYYEDDNKCKANAINLSINIDFLLTEHLKLKAEPYFNYTFNKDIVRDSNVDLTFAPVFGVKLGLKLMFRK